MRFRKLKQTKKVPRSEEKDPKTKFFTVPYPLKIKAFIVDMFMIYAPILYIITYIVLGDKDAFVGSELAPFFGVALYGLIYAFLLSKYAQTPGKKAYSLRILDATSGKNVSFFQALLRFVAFLFSATILIGLLFPLYRRDKKALHDLIFHTIEVRQED